MRVVFMGTPRFAKIVLDELISSDHEIVCVVTRPDAVRGRGKALISSPVKQSAICHEIPVMERVSLRDQDTLDELAALNPDVICVAAYGAILPKSVLEIPPFGCLNVHGSLLPRWRGAAPVERAILAGDSVTGIGIMRMEEGLDTGDVALVCQTAIEDKSADHLSDELASIGGKALVKVLDELQEKGEVTWTVQSEEGITYAEKIAKGELDIAPSLTTREALLRIQASSDNHPSKCIIAGKGVTVVEAHPCDIDLKSGSVGFMAKRLYLGLTDGAIELSSVKPDGKKVMEAKAFAAGIQGIKQGGITWGNVHE